jgi:hypothetical protein
MYLEETASMAAPDVFLALAGRRTQPTPLDEGGPMLKPGDRVSYKGQTRTVTDDYGPTFYPRYALDDDSLVNAEDVVPAPWDRPRQTTAFRVRPYSVKETGNPMDRELVAALESFVGAMDATGGVIIDRHGLACPVADPDWIDLGEAYLQACRALGREPVQADGDGS